MGEVTIAGGGEARTILHVDMDAFYASVELARRPELRNLPVVVGGGGERGVVAAASYEARRHGIRSAMSGAQARRRCAAVVFLPVDHHHYAEISASVHRIFETFTPLVEPLALDEAFLDVTGSLRHFGTGREIAERIRAEILATLSLQCSVGVASSKFVAKIASVDAKPRATPSGVHEGAGVVVVEAGAEAAYVARLTADRLWGVGPRTNDRLAAIGVVTVADLLAIDRRVLAASLGETSAAHLLALASGHDERPVVSDRQAKSVGHEETFDVDLRDPEAIGTELVRMCDLVAARVRSSVAGARTWTLKIRFHDFTTITRSHTWATAVDSAGEVLDELRPLMVAAVSGRRVRLLGVSASQFGSPSEQLDLFSVSGGSAGREGRRRADRAVDEIRERFGDRIIGPGSAVTGPERTDELP
jgi:DNA polymerase-4